jgi:hypothetical protein
VTTAREEKVAILKRIGVLHERFEVPIVFHAERSAKPDRRQ